MTRAHIYVRQINGLDAADIALAQRAFDESGNDFPHSAFTLPTTQIMVAERAGEPILVQPFYRSLVLGSLAFVGNQGGEYKAAAQHAMTAAAYTEAHRTAMLNVMMFTDTHETQAFASRHGYQSPLHPAFIMEVR